MSLAFLCSVLIRAILSMLLLGTLVGESHAQRVTRGKAKATIGARAATTKKASTRKAATRKVRANAGANLRRREGRSLVRWDARFKAKSSNRRRGKRGNAKNRGRLETIKGIYVGKKFTLNNPSTGRVDENATVVETGHESFGGIPFAYVRFSNGHKQLYAAERLQLVGKGFKAQKNYMKGVAARIDNAILKQLGVGDPSIRAVTLRGRNEMPRARARKNPVHEGPFIRLLGETLSPGEGLWGYYFGGKHTYVSRMYSAFDYGTRVHEKLHGMSNPFSDQAVSKDLTNMMEGMTDYFTYQVITPHFGIQPNKEHTYYPYVEFAEKVASKIGQERMHKLFFGKDKNLVVQMAREVDKAVGKRGAFYKAARQLEKDLPATLE